MTALLRKRLIRHTSVHDVLCLSGCFLLAIGMTMFLQPNRIAGGGTPGMAILICHLTGLSAGTVMLLINVPLLILGGYCLGKTFVWRTAFAVILISVLVDLLNETIQIPAATHLPALASVIGGAGIGLGVGLILKGDASAGGPTIITRIVTARSPISPGRLILLMDGMIVLFSAVVFGALEPALLSMLSVFVTGRCVDLVLSERPLKTPREQLFTPQAVAPPCRDNF